MKSSAPWPLMSMRCALEKRVKGVKVKGVGGLSTTLKGRGFLARAAAPNSPDSSLRSGSCDAS